MRGPAAWGAAPMDAEESRSEAPAVFLDQNVWIRLARASHGKQDDWKKAHDLVVAAAASGRVRFPLGLSHWVETARNANDEQRARLARFMAGIWEAHALRPFYDMIRPEAANAVLIMLEQPPMDLRSYALGKGLGHALGGQIPVDFPSGFKGDTSQKIHNLAVDYAQSPERVADLAYPEFAAIFRTLALDADAMRPGFQATADKTYARPDKVMRRRLADFHSMTGTVRDALVEAMLLLSENPKGLMDRHYRTQADIEAVRRTMPTVHTFHVMDYARSSTRHIKENDIWDFWLTNAIPYCDLVVTEKSWCNIAQDANLGSIYGTELAYTAEEVVAWLENHRLDVEGA